MILGLFTELLSDGGVQRVGRQAAAVLAAAARERGEACRLLSLNDAAGVHEVRTGDLAARVEGFGRRKGRLALAVLAAAPRVSRAYVAHPGLAPLALAPKLLRPASRYWVHAHGVEIWDRLPAATRLALGAATGIVAISRYTAERAATVQRIDPEKFRVLHNALDPDFAPAAGATCDCAGRARRGASLLTVARLAASERYKGVDTTLRALPAVARAVPEVTYTVVGEGDDRPRLERLAADVGVGERVRFLGRVSEAALRASYRDCDVYVMPSGGEGFGVAFLEAMAFAKPCVGAASGGAPEVVVDGATGFLVPYGAVDALADRLVRLLGDGAARARMGEAGRRRVEEHFTFEHFRRRLTAILS
jgi:glycosyltransferase involved in cell wall biosynthesis